MSRLIILILSCLLLFGCNYSKIDGGYGDLVSTTKITETKSDGTVVQTETVTKTHIQQNDNPEKPTNTEISITPKGIVMTTTFGASQNIAKVLASISLLQIPMYAGIILIIIGAVLAFALKPPIGSMRWGLVFIAIGTCMAVGSYLLAEYAIYFLFGLGIVLVWLGWAIYNLVTTHKVAEETIDTVQKAKEKGIINPEEFKNLANETQSDKTINFIRKTKNSKKWTK